MATEHTHRGGRLRAPLAALSRLSRLGDIPVVIMLAWAGWLAVPWSFSGLAQARAAAAAAAEPPPIGIPAAASQSEHPQIGDAPETRERLRIGVALDLGRSQADGTVDPARPQVGGAVDSTRPQVGDAVDPGRSQVGIAAAVRRGATGRAAWGLPAARAGQIETVRLARRDSPAEAVARERARIAGVVHDAAGHGLAAIAMQARIALVTFDDDPAQARASLQAISETSTTALAQLRAALEGIDPPDGDLPGLIAGVRAAGLPVDVEPADFTVPAHLQGTVYRVVRESLTNVLRHAGPTRALVRMGGDRREFVVEVADRGHGWTGKVENHSRTDEAESHNRTRVAEPHSQTREAEAHGRTGQVEPHSRTGEAESHSRTSEAEPHGQTGEAEGRGWAGVVEGRG
ncbi:hypothetical protein ITP53_42455, partial [Nonomuraea sp. K274]